MSRIRWAGEKPREAKQHTGKPKHEGPQKRNCGSCTAPNGFCWGVCKKKDAGSAEQRRIAAEFFKPL